MTGLSQSGDQALVADGAALRAYHEADMARCAS